MVIESIHHPWTSSISNGYSARHLEHVNASLTPSGMAAFIVHLQEVPNNGLNSFTDRLESLFDNTYYILPKDNIDAILILCSNTPISYSEFQTRLSADSDHWLGQIILKKYPIPTNASVDLSPQNRPSVPYAHLTALKDKLPSPTELWPNIPSSDIPKLEGVFDNHRDYLG